MVKYQACIKASEGRFELMGKCSKNTTDENSIQKETRQMASNFHQLHENSNSRLQRMCMMRPRIKPQTDQGNLNPKIKQGQDWRQKRMAAFRAIICNSCKTIGHISRNCPNERNMEPSSKSKLKKETVTLKMVSFGSNFLPSNEERHKNILPNPNNDDEKHRLEDPILPSPNHNKKEELLENSMLLSFNDSLEKWFDVTSPHGKLEKDVDQISKKFQATHIRIIKRDNTFSQKDTDSNTDHNQYTSKTVFIFRIGIG